MKRVLFVSTNTVTFHHWEMEMLPSPRSKVDRVRLILSTVLNCKYVNIMIWRPNPECRYLMEKYLFFVYRIGSQQPIFELHLIDWTRSVTKFSAIHKYWNRISMPWPMLLLVLVANVMDTQANVYKARVMIINSFYFLEMKLIFFFFKLK